MKKGFTVIELLVVIGILGLLMGIMLGSLGGSTDKARATQCLVNLHNLSTACAVVGQSTDNYPRAGSVEMEQEIGTSAVGESAGWVSWMSKGAYEGGRASSHKSSAGWFVSTYTPDIETRTYCLTNGSIWRAISANASAYVCPMHARYAKKARVVPVWSYVMNSFFTYDDTVGNENPLAPPAIGFGDVERGDRRLLFAELPFNTDNTAQKCSFSTGAGIALDPTLQYEKNELIGFNHKDGKRWYAHVCFADGHTEKLELPKGAGEAQVRKLTEWLCEGVDVSYNGSSYEELK